MTTFKTIAALASAAVLSTAFAFTSSAQSAAKPAEGKAAKIGEKAPNFTLPDTDGTTHTLADLNAEGKIVVLEWINRDCPYVIKHHEKNTTMRDLSNEYKDKGVVWVAINTGVEGKQGAGREINAGMREKWNIEYPVLLDESGDVGRLYGAKTTPHMFIIDGEGILRYDGAIDNNSSAQTLGDTNYVKQALDEILAGESVSEPTTRPYGCSVKY